MSSISCKKKPNIWIKALPISRGNSIQKYQKQEKREAWDIYSNASEIIYIVPGSHELKFVFQFFQNNMLDHIMTIYFLILHLTNIQFIILRYKKTLHYFSFTSIKLNILYPLFCPVITPLPLFIFMHWIQTMSERNCFEIEDSLHFEIF